MWKIWMEEIRKIASRKIIWLGIIVMLVFLTFRLYQFVENEYVVTIDGQIYQGREAIQRDQELAKEYAGPLTEEKVKAIHKRFGFYYYDVKKEYFIGNFCNQYITENMTDYLPVGGSDPESIKFYEGEEWEKNVSPLLKGDVQFDYIYGWNDLKETYGITVMVMLSMILLSMAVLVVSAICRNSFMAVVVSLILYVLPVVWVKVFAPMWILGERGTKLVNHFMVSAPVYLPMNWGVAFTEKQIVMHLCIALAVGCVSLLTGYRKYRNYQG